MLGGFTTAIVGLFAAAPRPTHHVHNLGAGVLLEPTQSVDDILPQLRQPTPSYDDPPHFKNTTSLAMEWVAWMRADKSFSYYLSHEVDDLIEYFCELKNYALPDFVECRSIIAGLPGVTHRRYRIKGPQFEAVRERTSAERPVLYRVSRSSSTYYRQSTIRNPGGPARAGSEQYQYRRRAA